MGSMHMFQSSNLNNLQKEEESGKKMLLFHSFLFSDNTFFFRDGTKCVS